MAKNNIMLSRDVVLKASSTLRPTLDPSGKIVYAPLEKPTEYAVYDAHQRAPTGFGLRVLKSKKSYIVQRAIAGSMTKWTVGDASIMQLDDARELARKQIEEAEAVGRTPKEQAVIARAAVWTLGRCFDEYIQYLETRKNRPAGKNTLDSVTKGRAKAQRWNDTPVHDIHPDDIVAWFEEIFAKTPTAAEASAAWITTAIKYGIDMEEAAAFADKRPPTLTRNPFRILRKQDLIRNRRALELAYEDKNRRNPMDPEEQLGKWMNAVWFRRADYPLGADYLILTLLWGMRRSESCKVQWSDRVLHDPTERASVIDLNEKKVKLGVTKNGGGHELPLGHFAMNILLQRRADSDRLAKDDPRKRWVFPARSPRSETGHYSDPTRFFKTVAAAAGADVLRPHDLRRTFGGIARALGIPMEDIKDLLNHSDLSDVTKRYTEIQWRALRDRVERIEEFIFRKSPVAYNALRPPKMPPMAVPDGIKAPEKRPRKSPTKKPQETMDA